MVIRICSKENFAEVNPCTRHFSVFLVETTSFLFSTVSMDIEALSSLLL